MRLEKYAIAIKEKISKEYIEMRLPKILQILKPFIAQWLEAMLLIYYSKTAKSRRCKQETGRILLARTDGLGDFIIWLSCAEEFKKLFPNKKIVLMLDSTKPTLELAEKMPHLFDEVFNIDIHNYTRFFSIWKMRKMEFDVVVQPVYSRVIFTDILLFACRADKRITLDTNSKFLTERQLKLSNRGFDQIVSASGEIKHELIRCGELMRGLGAKDFRAGLPVLETKRGEKEAFFISFPAASAQTKVWGTEKYAQVYTEIMRKTDWNCIIGGGKEDIPFLNEIVKMVGHKNKISVIAGKYNLSDTANIIKRAQMAIGNDTGAMHMAVACGTPSVVLMGDNEIGRFFPYMPENGDIPKLWVVDADMQCKDCNAVKDVPCKFPYGEKGAYHCVESITIEQCMVAVNQFLEMVGMKNERDDKEEYFDFTE